MLTMDETICSWLDGELDCEEAKAMQQRYDAEPEFAAQVDSMRRCDGLVRAAVPLEEVPAELLVSLGLSAPRPNVVSLDERRAAGANAPRRFALARWTGNDRLRIAAGLALVLGVGVAANSLLKSSDDAAPAADYRTLSESPPSTVAANALVMFTRDIGPARAKAIATSTGATVVGAPGASGAWKLQVAPDRRDSVLAALRANPHVIMAEPIDGANR